jgi:hypothetical protein
MACKMRITSSVPEEFTLEADCACVPLAWIDSDLPGLLRKHLIGSS